MKELFSDLRTALVTHSVFVILNILIVLTGILLPRYINNPDVRIESVDAIVDEVEVSIEPEDALKINRIRFDQGLLPRTRFDPCLAAIEYGFIPSICFKPLSRLINKAILAIDKKLTEINEVIVYYNDLEYLPVGELAKKISAINNKDYHSGTYLLEAIILEGYAKDEYKNLYINTIIRVMSNALQDVKRTAEEDLSTAKSVLALINPDSGKVLERSGDIIFDVVLSNRGHADAVIPPNATLELDGQSIPLKARTESNYKININNPEYGILRAGSVLPITYDVDQINLTLGAQNVLENAVSQKSTAIYRLIIEFEDKTISSTENLPIESTSIEYRNNDF